MTQKGEKRMMTLEERAQCIAEEANTCCWRSDGYEKYIYELALTMLQGAVNDSRG